MISSQWDGQMMTQYKIKHRSHIRGQNSLKRVITIFQGKIVKATTEISDSVVRSENFVKMNRQKS